MAQSPRDPSARAHLEHLWSDHVVKGAAGEPIIDVSDGLRASWSRSAEFLAPDIVQAPFEETAPERWRSSRLARVFALVEEQMRQAADDGDMVAALTDAQGTVVWSWSGPSMARRAEQVAFVPGGRWDETSTGTNAIGLALRDARPSTVWSAEHYAPMVHDWVCYAAPIIDPATGRPEGVLDLSGFWTDWTPMALATVTALTRLMGVALTADLGGTASVGGPDLVLRSLGAAEVRLDSTVIMLPPRQVEILCVLSLAPDGLALEELHDRIYGERPVSPVTTRAELSHLRRSLGSSIANRPYRLTANIRADHIDLLVAIEEGRLDDALDLYRGPMLARSEAPAIAEHRNVLDVALRSGVLSDGAPDRLVRLSHLMPNDDFVHDSALAALPPRDARRAILEGRLAALR